MGLRIIIIALLVISQLIFGCPAWLADTHPFLRALVYPFFHANVFHLAANSLAVWTVFRRKNTDNKRTLVISYLISAAVSPLALRPCIGISNLIFAAIALRTPPLRSRWWKQPSVILFLAIMFLFLLLPQFSAVTHIAAFAAGVVVTCIGRWFKNLNRYAGRYL